jgi:endonuclease YncB( thermonuclease family)
MRTEDRRRRPPPPARRRRDPVARLGPWLLIAAVVGAFIFGHFGARVGFQQIGPMALQTLKAATGQRLAVHGQSNTLAGPVRVVDGDTIVLTDTDTHIRLNGVDAPEVVHPGYDHDDPFGPESRDEMRRIVGDKIVRCELNGERSYERLVGVCFLPDGTDIGAEIIRRGLALDSAHFSGSRSRTLEPAGVRAIIRQARYC